MSNGRENTQARASLLLGARTGATPPSLIETVAARRPSSFSVFNPDDSRAASEVAAHFALIASDKNLGA